ncbi:hypothetical protein BH09SUM1_BH09SUM1_09740 [soil metagenome]
MQGCLCEELKIYYLEKHSPLEKNKIKDLLKNPRYELKHGPKYPPLVWRQEGETRQEALASCLASPELWKKFDACVNEHVQQCDVSFKAVISKARGKMHHVGQNRKVAEFAVLSGHTSRLPALQKLDLGCERFPLDAEKLKRITAEGAALIGLNARELKLDKILLKTSFPIYTWRGGLKRKETELIGEGKAFLPFPSTDGLESLEEKLRPYLESTPADAGDAIRLFDDLSFLATAVLYEKLGSDAKMEEGSGHWHFEGDLPEFVVLKGAVLWIGSDAVVSIAGLTKDNKFLCRSLDS